jgi:hypothetical protein
VRLGISPGAQDAHSTAAQRSGKQAFIGDTLKLPDVGAPSRVPRPGGSLTNWHLEQVQERWKKITKDQKCALDRVRRGKKKKQTKNREE